MTLLSLASNDLNDLNEVNVDGLEVSESIYCIGMATRVGDTNKFVCLANYYSTLALIEVKLTNPQA